MNLADLLGGLLTGGIGGFVSGFLGVTSGGILVPLLVLILGKDQHVAQGISLVAQVVPTSLSGVRNYSQSGHRVSWRWLTWLAIGFCIGGGIGAMLATHVSDRALQWSFVGYLLILLVIIVSRPPRSRVESGVDIPEDVPLNWAGVACRNRRRRRMVVGFPRHRWRPCDHRIDDRTDEDFAAPRAGDEPRSHGAARDLPAALLYVQQGTELPWLTILSLIAGLWVGTGFGARFANRVGSSQLRFMLIIMIAAMTLFMAFKAWR
jgi:hypothetical protein